MLVMIKHGKKYSTENILFFIESLLQYRPIPPTPLVRNRGGRVRTGGSEECVLGEVEKYDLGGGRVSTGYLCLLTKYINP